MGAVQDYVRANAAEMALDLGATTDELRANPGDKSAWARFGMGASKSLWSALPAESRDPALAALNDQIAIAHDIADLGVSVAGEVLTELAVSTDAIPIVGGAISAVIDVIGNFIFLAQTIRGSREEFAAMDKNIEQWNMFRDSTSPNSWALGLLPVALFENYIPDKADRVDGERFRLMPCIRPSYRDSAAWGLGWADSWEGQCYPGRPMRAEGFDYERKGGTDCKAQCAVSSLFWPFWSPNHTATPIGVYRFESGYAIADPNEWLVARQQALLADPATNMRVRGDRVSAARTSLSRYFRDQMQSNGGMLFCSDGTIPGMHNFTTGIDSKRYRIDSKYQERHAHGVGGFDYFWHPNGTVGSYGTGPDLTQVGVPSMGPPLSKQDLAYTAAQLNTVVTGVKAFFVARAAMLEQPYAMQALLAKGGIAGGRRYDRAVRSAMRASAESVK